MKNILTDYNPILDSRNIILCPPRVFLDVFCTHLYIRCRNWFGYTRLG